MSRWKLSLEYTKLKYEFVESIKLLDGKDVQLMSCNSAQNLFVNGYSSEAVAISMEKQKKRNIYKVFSVF